MIKAIIFDCFGVLTTDLWREFVDSLSSEEDANKARELNHQYDAGRLSLKDFLSQVEEATGKRPVQVENLLDNEATKNTALLSYIEQLKESYKIGLISNIATNWIRDKLLTTGEQQLFDAMVLSFEAGTTKPDPRIYELMCEKLDIEPREAVFIDDVKRYCEAAEDLGMKSVHYQDFRQMKRDLQAILDQE